MNRRSKVLGRATLLLASAALCLGATPALADTGQNVVKAPHDRIDPIKPPRDLCPAPVPPQPRVGALYCDIVLPPAPPMIPKPIQPPLTGATAQATAVGSISITARTVPTPPWPHPSPFPEPWPNPTPWPEPWPWPGPTFPVNMLQANHDLENPDPGMPIPKGIGDNKGKDRFTGLLV